MALLPRFQGGPERRHFSDLRGDSNLLPLRDQILSLALLRLRFGCATNEAAILSQNATRIARMGPSVRGQGERR